VEDDALSSPPLRRLLLKQNLPKFWDSSMNFVANRLVFPIKMYTIVPFGENKIFFFKSNIVKVDQVYY
jgi:hypothetical protein